jgi:hypothetical protein
VLPSVLVLLGFAAGGAVAPPVSTANPSSAGRRGRIASTRGTYSPVSSSPVSSAKKRKLPQALRPPHTVAAPGAFIPNVVPIRPIIDGNRVIELWVETLDNATREAVLKVLNSLVETAIKPIQSQLESLQKGLAAIDSQENMAAQQKILKALETEEAAALTARQIEALLLLALVE